MKLIKIFIIILIINTSSSFANVTEEFVEWKSNFKKIALDANISESTFDMVMINVKFYLK